MCFLWEYNSGLSITRVSTLKHIWTYGIQLWECSKPSNTKIQQTYQSRILRMIANTSWYVSNQTFHENLKVPFIKDVLYRLATKYRNKNLNHDNNLINNPPSPTARRLERQSPKDLVRWIEMNRTGRQHLLRSLIYCVFLILLL